MPIIGIVASAGSHGKYWIGEYSLGTTTTGTNLSIPFCDSSNNLYILGQATNYSNSSFKQFSPWGNFNFEQTLTGPTSPGGIFLAHANTDSSGNIYVTDALATDVGNNSTFYSGLLKYSSTGTLLSQIKFNNTYTGTVGAGSIGGINVDVNGNINIVGQSPHSSGSGNTQMFTMQLSSSGSINWQTSPYINAGSSIVSGAANGIVSDVSGNIYTAGWIESLSSGTFDFVVFKYSSSGSLQWQKFIATYSSVFVGASSIMIDSSGNIVVGVGGGNNANIVKLSSSGTFIGGVTLGYPSGTISGIPVLFQDTAGNIYASTGYGVTKLASITSSGSSIIWNRRLANASGTTIYSFASINSLDTVVLAGNDTTDANKAVIISVPNNGTLTGTYSPGSTNYIYGAPSTAPTITNYSDPAITRTVYSESSGFSTASTSFTTGTNTGTYNKRAIG